MNILQLCKKFPYPIKDGEVLAINNLGRALTVHGAGVSICCMITPKHYFDPRDLPADYNWYKNIHSKEVDTRIKPLPALFNLFSSNSYHIQRFTDPGFANQLAKVLSEESYQVIQLETLYLAPYIPVIRKYSDAIITMRAHNVEHEIWQRISSNTPNVLKRWYLQLLTNRLRSFEVEQLNKYDLLLPITQRDESKMNQLGFKGKSLVVPVGIPGNEYTPDPSSFRKKLSISFIGSLDWMPNMEGLQWFLKRVWGKVNNQLNDVRLHLAGRNAPDWLLQLGDPTIVVHGEVQDAKEFINSHSVMVVPLLSGSGMRVKILEGMALGKVIITTSVGLEGIEAEPGQHVLVADSPDAFIEALDYCYNNQDQLPAIGQRARQFLERRYDNLAIGKMLLDFYKEQIANKH